MFCSSSGFDISLSCNHIIVPIRCDSLLDVDGMPKPINADVNEHHFCGIELLSFTDYILYIILVHFIHGYKLIL